MSKSSDHQEKMFSLIELYKESNLSRVAFCEQQGIPVWKFHYWQKKYREIGNHPDSAGFVRLISAKEKDKMTDIGVITIQYPNGVSLQIPSGASLSTIRTLLSLI